jgi:hypothetical protein
MNILKIDFITLVTRPLQCIGICALLVACSSTSDIINVAPIFKQTPIYHHNKTLWQQSALSDESIFAQHGLKIFAAITWQKRSNGETYRFSNIQIAPEADQYAINLLHPDFSQKMACGWYCEYLDQPISQTTLGPYTMLDKTFEGNRNILYGFYDEMHRLENNLQSLSPERLAVIPEVIAQLVNTQQKFDSLKQINAFLNDYFDDIDFQKFSPEQQALASPFPLPEGYQSISASRETELIVADADLLATFTNEPSLQTLLKQSENKQTQKIAADLSATPSTLPLPDTFWLQQKSLPILAGQVVCSYQDNYFGEVTAVNGNRINLALKGQVKQLIDGIVMSAPAGSLFSKDSKIAYLDTDGQRSFSRSQLAPCALRNI